MTWAKLGRWLLLAGMAAGTFLSAEQAQAHGRFPNAGLVLRHPTDANQLLVRTTYGLLHSNDAGGRWLWSCPEAVGWDADLEDPAIAFTGSRIVAGTFEGLSLSSEDACGWNFLGGEAEGRFFRDLVLMDPSHLLAVASNGLGDDQFDVDVWQSNDGGDNWAELASAPPSDFLAVAITAPADGSRIYLSGRDGVGSYEGVIYRSDDNGDSWDRLPIPGTIGGERVPYLAGVHPTDPDIVYVASIAVMGLEVVHFELMVSEDGGDNFTTFFERDRGVSGFALSPDGTRVAVGGRQDGLWIGNTDTHQLAQVNELECGCIAWHEEGIYACGSQFTDGFTLGISKDDGVSFETLMQLDSPCGPLECPAGTIIGDMCPARWELERQELDAGKCNPPTPPSDGSCDCTVTALGSHRHPSWLGLFAAVGLLSGLMFTRRRR